MPPEEDSYRSLAQKRRRKGIKKPYPRADVQRAAEGLSVVDGLENAREHARTNQHLGDVLVRYLLPDDLDCQVEHILGPPYHFTLFIIPLTRLADFLDMEWWEFQDFSSETAGD